MQKEKFEPSSASHGKIPSKPRPSFKTRQGLGKAPELSNASQKNLSKAESSSCSPQWVASKSIKPFPEHSMF